MNKLLKTNKRTASEILLYMFTLIMGLYLIFYPDFGHSNPLFTVACMFVVLAFISFIAYYAGKKEGDYELLLLSLVNIVIAVFLYYFRDGNLAFILSFSLSAWSFFYITLKMISAFQYKFENHKQYSLKIITAIITLLIASVSIFKLFNDDVLVSLLVYGYFFIIISSLNFLEVALNTIVFDTNDKNTFKIIKPTQKKQTVQIKQVKTLVEEKEIEASKKKPTTKKKPTKTKK